MTPDQHKEVLLMQVFEAFDVALNTSGGAPIMWILAQAQRDCVTAMRALIDVNPNDAQAIQRLQNEIHRNEDLIGWMREAVVKGEALFREMTADERHFVGEFAEDSESGDDVTED